MTRKIQQLVTGALAAISLIFIAAGPASAHVTVKPDEVPSATYQVFTVSVPNEKDNPTTQVRLVVPEGVSGVLPTQKAGWTIETVKDGDGEAARVTEITWKDGEVAAERRDEFTFSAKTPAEVGDIEWKAYQTYADGSTVAWDQPANDETGHGEETDKGPFSVTKITGDTGDEKKAAYNKDITSNALLALFIAGAATLIALIAIYLASRQKSTK